VKIAESLTQRHGESYLLFMATATRTPSDAGLRRKLGSVLKQYADQAEAAADAARVRAEEARAIANLDGLDVTQLFFTVSIYDPWDADLSIERRSTYSNTARGLGNAIKAAEREYADHHGIVRSDGVLTYTVTLNMIGTTVPIPDKVWQPYSQQTVESLAINRRAAR
jgi:hypothetical protein